MDKVRNIIGGLGNLMFKEAYIYSQFKDGLIPDLYLQDEKYFVKYKDEIKHRFGTRIEPLPYVAIHVRRGDYVDNPFYVDLFTDGYYERAMQEFPGEQFCVFTDDVEWCKGQDLFSDCIFSNALSDIDDFNRMAGCKGHIIANSSFSWWAAWLAPYSQKIVAPKKWHPDNIIRTVLPNTWLQK